jgi:aurora kinase
MKTTFCGTLDYVSPEMKDKGLYTSKVDLWSIGVLTFELLTGSAPFKNEINQWKKKGSKRNIQWDWHILYPPEISALGESFMRNLLRENPDERASLRFCRNHFFIRKYK